MYSRPRLSAQPKRLRRLGGGAAALERAAGIVALVIVGCGGQPVADETPSSPTPVASSTTDQARARPLFTERAEALGIDFVHFNGMSGQFYFSEVVGAGAALFDMDGDGDLDALLVQGQMLGPGVAPSDALIPPDASALPLRARLYRNQLREAGAIGFVDVTEASGLRADGYGMGVAVGDWDADGDPDLYVTAFGPNQMWRNDGDGHFTEVTERARVSDNRWSTSASFLDYDGDGWLDLYVGNYVDFGFANHKQCFAATSARDYCGPLSYEPLPDRLFRNRGDGTFEDVSAHSQIATEFGGALGVVGVDFDRDGHLDIYVANDGMPNQLWINQGNGRFKNTGLLSGTAVNANGQAEASMGVDVGDVDGDGDEDIFITHLDSETNTLYLNDGNGLFEDGTAQTGVGGPSRGYTGFGAAWLDYDGDGWLDLFAANGAVKTIAALAAAGDEFPLDQINQLFRNRGGGQLEEVTASAGPAFELAEVSRGAAFGDVDNDGDTDILVMNNAGRTRLLINEVGNRSSWLGLRLVAGPTAYDSYGATATCVLSDGRRLLRRVRADGSYCSSNDPRLLFGLGPSGAGASAAVSSIEVRWPDGLRETFDWSERPTSSYVELIRGTGESP